ncbi:aminoacyl-tRNA hydrolase [Patescibacteria group bacterium]|nr:aminoacyl-tRNA hydrolase [Patescibacteria group bacterium]
MNITIVGLGNPRSEYEGTRHNTGATLVEHFHDTHSFPEWKTNKKINALISSGEVGKKKVDLILLQTFMNKSGSALKTFITNKKKAEHLIVIYDDLDLPIGTFKIAFSRGSGGHKGVESIVRGIKTKEFIRVRVGITPTTPSGKLKKPKLKKPQGDTKVIDFIMGKFTKKEYEILAEISDKIDKALLCLVEEGREVAMNIYNQK